MFVLSVCVLCVCVLDCVSLYVSIVQLDMYLHESELVQHVYIYANGHVCLL